MYVIMFSIDMKQNKLLEVIDELFTDSELKKQLQIQKKIIEIREKGGKIKIQENPEPLVDKELETSKNRLMPYIMKNKWKELSFDNLPKVYLIQLDIEFFQLLVEVRRYLETHGIILLSGVRPDFPDYLHPIAPKIENVINTHWNPKFDMFLVQSIINANFLWKDYFIAKINEYLEPSQVGIIREQLMNLIPEISNSYNLSREIKNDYHIFEFIFYVANRKNPDLFYLAGYKGYESIKSKHRAKWAIIAEIPKFSGPPPDFSDHAKEAAYVIRDYWTEEHEKALFESIQKAGAYWEDEFYQIIKTMLTPELEAHFKKIFFWGKDTIIHAFTFFAQFQKNHDLEKLMEQRVSEQSITRICEICNSDFQIIGTIPHMRESFYRLWGDKVPFCNDCLNAIMYDMGDRDKTPLNKDLLAEDLIELVKLCGFVPVPSALPGSGGWPAYWKRLDFETRKKVFTHLFKMRSRYEYEKLFGSWSNVKKELGLSKYAKQR